MKNETTTATTSTPTSPAGAPGRKAWKIVAGVAGALIGLTVAVVGGYAGYLKLSGTPLIDEWSCMEGQAPVTMPAGGSYCETEGATLPEGDTWHPLGNRPHQCEDRWGWDRAYTTWATDDPEDPGYEIGCVRDDADLPADWKLVPEDADGDYVPEGANPSYPH